MLTYFCCTLKKFSLNPYYFPRSPRFLKKRITQAVASLTRGRPWALAGCGANLCWSGQAVASLTAALAAAGTFVEARCFLRAYREAVPCIFFVILELFSLSVIFGLFFFCHVRPWAGHLPYRFPGQAGEWRKRKKLRNDEREKKPGNDNKKRRTGNDRRKRKYEHGGKKTNPGCVKEAERSARRRGCLV